MLLFAGLVLSGCGLFEPMTPTETLPPLEEVTAAAAERAAPAAADTGVVLDLPEPAGKVRFNPHYPDGRRLFVTSEGRLRTRLAGGDSSEVSTRQQVVQQVGRDERGRVTVSVRFGDLEASGHGPYGRWSYGGGEGAEVPEAAPRQVRAWAASQGRSLTVITTPRGKALRVDGADALYEALVAALPDPVTGAERAALADLYSDRGWLYLLDQSTHWIPWDPVEVGDTWKDTLEVELPLLYPVEIEVTFELRRVDEADGGRVAVVKYDGTLARKDNRLRKLTLKGLYRYDLQRGAIIEDTGSLYKAFNISGMSFDSRTEYTLTVDVFD